MYPLSGYSVKQMHHSLDEPDPWILDENELRLFAIDNDGKLHIYGSPEPFEPKEGWRVILLVDKNSS